MDYLNDNFADYMADYNGRIVDYNYDCISCIEYADYLTDDIVDYIMDC
jgi:hypothetical protein